MHSWHQKLVIIVIIRLYFSFHSSSVPSFWCFSYDFQCQIFIIHSFTLPNFSCVFASLFRSHIVLPWISFLIPYPDLNFSSDYLYSISYTFRLLFAFVYFSLTFGFLWFFNAYCWNFRFFFRIQCYICWSNGHYSPYWVQIFILYIYVIWLMSIKLPYHTIRVSAFID